MTSHVQLPAPLSDAVDKLAIVLRQMQREQCVFGAGEEPEDIPRADDKGAFMERDGREAPNTERGCHTQGIDDFLRGSEVCTPPLCLELRDGVL